MTKRNEIVQFVGRFIITIEPAIGLDMVDGQRLTKGFNALFLGHFAMLTGITITLASLALLSLPIGTMTNSRRAINVLRVLFSSSVSVSTGACAILARPPSSLEIRRSSDKSNTASLTNQFYCILDWTRLNCSVLTLWRTMLAPSVVKSRAFNLKGLITKFTNGINKALCMYSAFSGTMNLITKQRQNWAAANLTVHHRYLKIQNPHGRFAPLPRQCETIRVLDKDVIMTKCLRIGLSRQIKYIMGMAK